LTYQLNFRSFKLTVDKHIDLESSFLNTPDAFDQPGASETRDVTLEVNTFLEDDYAAQHKPFYDFANRHPSGASKANIVYYASVDEVFASNGYIWRMELPALYWEAADPSAKEAGAIPTSWRGRGIKGTTLVPNTGSHPTSTDLRMVSAVKDAALVAGGDADANFTASL